MARNLIGTATTATFTQAAAVNLAGVVLFLVMARWTAKGSITARTLACVLFGLRTVAVLIGPGELSALSPWPAPLCRVFTFRNGPSDQGALRRKRQTCLPARRPDVTAVSAGEGGHNAGTLRLG
jgi:hypothetical protein